MSEICKLDGEICRVPWAATPSMDLLSAEMIMNRHGVNQAPVVTEFVEDNGGNLVGLLDRDCINLTCRFSYLHFTLHLYPSCYLCVFLFFSEIHFFFPLPDSHPYS